MNPNPQSNQITLFCQTLTLLFYLSESECRHPQHNHNHNHNHITFPCFFFYCIQITSSTHDIQYDSTRLLRYCLYYFIITIITKFIIKNIIDPRQVLRQTSHDPRQASHSCLDSTPVWLYHRHSFTLSDHLSFGIPSRTITSLHRSTSWSPKTELVE